MFLASKHLLDEKQKVDNKIQLLMEEKQLIDDHLIQQERKMTEVIFLFSEFKNSCIYDIYLLIIYIYSYINKKVQCKKN